MRPSDRSYDNWASLHALSQDQFNVFPEKVKTDAQFQDKLNATNTLDEGLVLVPEDGFTTNSEDI